MFCFMVNVSDVKDVRDVNKNIANLNLPLFPFNEKLQATANACACVRAFEKEILWKSVPFCGKLVLCGKVVSYQVNSALS